MAYKFNPFTGKLDETGPILTGTGTVSAAADGTAAIPGIAFTNDLNTGIYRPGADQLAISTAGTGRVFVDANGCVGVGMTPDNQAYRLQVYNASQDVALLSVGNNVSGSGALNGLVIGQNQNDSVFINRENGSQQFWTNGSERLRVTSDGKVGIGTSTPSELLHLSGGDIAFSSSQNRSLRVLTGGANIAGGSLTLEAGSAGTGGSGVNAGQLTFKAGNGYDGLGNLQRGDILLYAGANAYTNDYHGSIRFFTASGVGTTSEKVRIDSSGKVGIGTSVPDTALHVNGVFDSSSNFASTNSNKGLTINSSLSDATGVQYGVVFSTSQSTNNDYPVAGVLAIPDAPSSGIGGSLSFQTHTSATTSLAERARIDANGRLLVGTSTAVAAGAKLQTVDGITFPAAQVASADPNTLDDYEEGTWTPTVQFGGASVGIAGTFTGTYTKTGNVVTLCYRLSFSSKGTSTGAMTITGVPFDAGSGLLTVSGFGYMHRLASLQTAGQLYLQLDGTTIYPRFTGYNSGNTTALTNTDIADTTELRGGIVYRV